MSMYPVQSPTSHTYYAKGCSYRNLHIITSVHSCSPTMYIYINVQLAINSAIASSIYPLPNIYFIYPCSKCAFYYLYKLFAWSYDPTLIIIIYAEILETFLIWRFSAWSGSKLPHFT